MMESLLGAGFWIGLLQIIWINIILSGDNAVVVAMAARALPPDQQRQAIVWGSGFAIVLRVALTLVAAQLMELPLVEILGALLLLWIGLGLLKNEDAPQSPEQAMGSASLMHAVRTILLADLVMSLDNVIAVAAAAKGNWLLLVIGLAASIPLVIFGSTLVIRLMERFPAIVWLGAGLIGWVAGETFFSDHVMAQAVQSRPWLPYVGATCGASLVLGLGRWRQVHGRAYTP